MILQFCMPENKIGLLKPILRFQILILPQLRTLHSKNSNLIITSKKTRN